MIARIAAPRRIRSLLHFREASAAGWTVLSATGDLDPATGTRLTRRTDELVDRGVRGVCLDLRAVAYLDVGGVAAVLHAGQAIGAVGGQLLVVAPGDDEVARVLEPAVERGALDVAGSVEQAVAGGAPSPAGPSRSR